MPFIYLFILESSCGSGSEVSGLTLLDLVLDCHQHALEARADRPSILPALPLLRPEREMQQQTLADRTKGCDKKPHLANDAFH